MCFGLEKGSLMGEQRPFYEEDNWVKISLAIPFKYNPGTHFVYNNVGPYLAGILVQRRFGCDLVSYLTPRLFSKLGIKRPTWETAPLNSFGAGGLFLTLSELHKFGLFYLNMTDPGVISRYFSIYSGLAKDNLAEWICAERSFVLNGLSPDIRRR